MCCGLFVLFVAVKAEAFHRCCQLTRAYIDWIGNSTFFFTLGPRVRDIKEDTTGVQLERETDHG